jgi:3-hydroxybutyryl-CoA dehydrogenase
MQAKQGYWLAGCARGRNGKHGSCVRAAGLTCAGTALECKKQLMPAKHTRSANRRAKPVDVGVIGLGLMGNSIVACLLAAGHAVVGVTNDMAQGRTASHRIRALLAEMRREKLLAHPVAITMRRFTVSAEMAQLSRCDIVFESVTEELVLKQAIIRDTERVISSSAIIATNTSAIPITLLQQEALHPERILGIHWDEPAHVTRFLEIIPGSHTTREYVDRVCRMASAWGKEPAVLKREIRGFITNRISYAMFREACHLVESGICTVEDVDRSVRNDVGWWMPFAGPFRYMDLMGVEGYARVMKDLLPELCTNPEVPRLMREAVGSGGRAAASRRGFYKYKKGEVQRWHDLFTAFNYRIRELTSEYSRLTSAADAAKKLRT